MSSSSADDRCLLLNTSRSSATVADKQIDYSIFFSDTKKSFNYCSSPLPASESPQPHNDSRDNCSAAANSENSALSGNNSVKVKDVYRKRALARPEHADEAADIDGEGVTRLGDAKRIKIDNEYDQIMFGIFQPWVLKTYGDLAKTKTITLKKQYRIMKTLRGQEMNNPDSSKFRFWVKSKGFTTTKPREFKDIFVAIEMDKSDDGCKLYIPNNSDIGSGGAGVNSGTNSGGSRSGQTYRKVAVVEHFYNIIYDVHVSLGSKSGRHAGQKRTYRTITEYYAFLPREAVTKFLSLCNDCKKIRRTFSPAHLIFEDSVTESSSECDRNKLENNFKKDILRITSTATANTTTAINSSTPTTTTTTTTANGKTNPIDWEEKINMDQKQPMKMDGEYQQLLQLHQNQQQQQSQSASQPQQPPPPSNSTNIFADNYFSEIYSKLFEYYNTQNNNNSSINNNNNSINSNSNGNNNNNNKNGNMSNGTGHNVESGNKQNMQISNDVMIYYQLLKQFYESSNGLNPAGGEEGLKNPPQLVPDSSSSSSSSSSAEQMLAIRKSLGLGHLYDALKPKEDSDYAAHAHPADEGKHLTNPLDCLTAGDAKSVCKSTTPPKKRYSMYSGGEDIGASMLMGDLPKLPLPFVQKLDFQAVAAAASATISPTANTTHNSPTSDTNSQKLMPNNKSLATTTAADDELNLNASDKENEINSCVSGVVNNNHNNTNNNHNNGGKLLNSNYNSNINISGSGSSSAGNSGYYRKLGAPEIKPITSTYLELTRSMGLSDDDALNLDSISSSTSDGPQENNMSIEDAYAGLVKDADKLKLMLLAWNYQNSAAVRNGTEGPDLATMGGLWAQYQNAITLGNKQGFPMTGNLEQNSPIENQDETNSSEHKDDDDVSEDESDDRIEPIATDPERLKAFNMFVRLFVDENLDRMIPISKQPKEKIQAIIDSCTRQFPEFSERARKRLRTYLKSCRRNKKAREGWENTSRPTPAHLTSVQAEQILALACENESMNAKRMRIGLEPISQGTQPQNSTNGETSMSSTLFPGLQTKIEPDSHTTALSIATNVPKSSPNTAANDLNIMRSLSNATNLLTTTTNSSAQQQQYNNDISFAAKAQQYQGFLSSQNSSTAPAPAASAPAPTSAAVTTTNGPTDLSLKRPPLISHKLNPNEITAVKQLVTGYRESAAFLMRSADELEHLLLQQP